MPTESYRFPTDGPVHLHLRSGRGTVEVIADDVPETLVDVSGRHDVGIVRVSASDDGRQVVGRGAPHLAPRRHPPLRHHRAPAQRAPPSTSAPRRRASPPEACSPSADAKTASGALSIEQVEGDCRAHSASGDIELGTIGGTVDLKSASGDLRVARVGGRCTARTASGAVDVGWAGDLVSAVSASGDVTVRDAARGEVICKSTSGDVADRRAQGHARVARPHHRVGPHHLEPRPRRRARRRQGGGRSR